MNEPQFRASKMTMEFNQHLEISKSASTDCEQQVNIVPFMDALLQGCYIRMH